MDFRQARRWGIGAAMLLACSGAGIARGGGGAEPQRAALEAEYLAQYAFLICAGASYAQLEPPPARIIALLRDEAWVFVEKGSVGAEVYAALYELAMAAGRGIPPQAAIRGCMQWRDSDANQEFIRARIGEEGG